MSNGSSSSYVGACRKDIPYPSVSQESVPSQIDNLVNALYGAITKTVQNGRVIWDIPCDPTTAPATILGVSRNTNEGLLCYIIRALGVTIPTGFVTLDGIQTLINKTLTAPVINSPTINNLTATGTLSLPAGSITTSMIANGSIVDIDVSASAAIAYSKLALGSSIVNSDINSSAAISNSKLAGNPVSTNTASTIVLRDASGNFSTGTITANLTGNVTGAGTSTFAGNVGIGTTSTSTSAKVHIVNGGTNLRIDSNLDASGNAYVVSGGSTSCFFIGTIDAKSVCLFTNGAGRLTIGSTGSIDAGGNPINSVGGIQGTTTNDNALGGYVGEFVTSTVAVGSAVALTSGATANVASLSLTAGDWDVRGQVDYRAGATTSITILKQGVSTTSATLGSQDTFTTNVFAAVVPTASNDIGNTFRQQRISIGSTTTIYLVVNATFTLSTLSAYGTISARRIR